MTYEEALQKFGLPALPQYRDEIRQLLVNEIELERKGKGDEELLLALSWQLFSIGLVEDSFLIWEAKQSSEYAIFAIDTQLVCGAGLDATIEYLTMSTDQSASTILDELTECVQAGDFDGWTPQWTIDQYRKYHKIDSLMAWEFIHGLFKKKSGTRKASVDAIVSQPPGEVFPWPQGIVITAIDEVIIAIPLQLFGKDEAIGSVIIAPDDVQFALRKDLDVFLIRLQPGLSVSLTKSCQAYIAADDKQHRRFKISGSYDTKAA
jgi:hypothetical protein